MNEFQNFATDNLPIFFYLRIYRENGKLRLEALKEAIALRPFDNVMTFHALNRFQAQICLYYDGLKPDFELPEPIVNKIYDYFSGAWFFSQPKPPKPSSI